MQREAKITSKGQITVPREIRHALGPVTKKNVYDEDVPAEIQLELWRQFRTVLEILRASGKLGAVHFQFAPWVAFHPKNFEYIEHCRNARRLPASDRVSQ